MNDTVSLFSGVSTVYPMDTILNAELTMKEYTQDRFLLATPYPTAAIILLYLYMVFVYTPNYMKDKEAFNLKNLILVFNVAQIFINSYLLYSVIQDLFISKNDYFCLLPSKSTLSDGYSYYLLKVVDLFETVFFVLKKKNNQVSFLHVYHHVLIFILTYVGLHTLAMGHCIIYGIINCFVHTVMYTYYFISANNPHINLIKFKKFVTQIQLLQFFILLIHVSWPLYYGHCYLNSGLIWLAISQSIVMIFLFGKFYLKTYMSKEIKMN